MSKHTPGPWKAYQYWVEPKGNDQHEICNCHPESMGMALTNGFGEKLLKRSFAEQCANARLIAAAPDMHALLTMAVARLGLEEAPPLLGAWLEEARQLLARIE